MCAFLCLALIAVAGSGGRDRFVSVLGWPSTSMSEYDIVSAEGEIEVGVVDLYPIVLWIVVVEGGRGSCVP